MPAVQSQSLAFLPSFVLFKTKDWQTPSHDQKIFGDGPFEKGMTRKMASTNTKFILHQVNNRSNNTNKLNGADISYVEFKVCS